MKKNFTKLLIISIVCAVISISLCSLACEARGAKYLNQGANEASTSNNAAIGFVLGFPVLMLADILVGIMVYIIPLITLCTIVILQGISRLIQIGIEKKWKDTTSKVITIISASLQLILCFILLFNILIFSVNKLFLILALALNVGCIVIFIKEIANCMQKGKMKENN